MSERRRSLRQKILYRGIVYFDNSPVASECTVRDISETGARLKFSAPLMRDISRLKLEVPLKGLKYQCDIVWHAESEVGVSFIGATISDQKNDSPAIERRISDLEASVAELRHLVNQMVKCEKETSSIAQSCGACAQKNLDIRDNGEVLGQVLISG